MAMKSYRYQAEILVKDYLLADPFVRYTSVLGGIFMCKMAYDFTQLISSFYFKVCFTYKDPTDRVEQQVSVGYFMTDLAMIFWLYPSLGGMEYVLHHMLSIISISYSMLSGEGQLYTYMVLISETTTPGINLRWFLDTAGMKRSSAYLVNGVAKSVGWLVARIFLFLYLFYHIYLHYDQIQQMHTFGYLLSLLVPIALFAMNMMWFGKILRGLKKMLSGSES
ncbi:TLC [Musa troglodytarum]|uniref:TLC n=1 Tax=Musa troglodytarum TaxID=320322 RepID=A0A9E7IFU9_9LILI|nr:TLC [Musa troglodytarum]